MRRWILIGLLLLVPAALGACRQASCTWQNANRQACCTAQNVGRQASSTWQNVSQSASCTWQKANRGACCAWQNVKNSAKQTFNPCCPDECGNVWSEPVYDPGYHCSPFGGAP